MFKLFAALIILLIIPAYADTIATSDKLTVTKLSDGVYVHTSNDKIGLIVIDESEALIISTRASVEKTQNSQVSSIVRYVADRWHPDAIGGSSPLYIAIIFLLTYIS